MTVCRLVLRCCVGSRGATVVQNQLASGGPDTVQYLLDQVRLELPDIIRDMFGNYFVQALFRVANDRQREIVLCALEPFLLDIACDRNGTYALQSIVDQVRLLLLACSCLLSCSCLLAF